MKCGCTETTPCNKIGCGCKFKVDAGCITYSGADLTAAGFVSGDSLTTILTTINQNFVDYGPGDYITMTTEAPGSHCQYGGLRLDLRSGQTNAIKSTQYLCGVNSNLPSSGGIALTDLSGTAPITYNNLTGAIGIQVANTSQGGYLTSADWTIFNGKGYGDLLKNGTVALTNHWDAGSFTITSNKLVSNTDATIHGLTVGLGGNNQTSNTVLGSGGSLTLNTTGVGNTTIGSASLASNTTGSINTAVGYTTLLQNTTGDYNTGIGSNALASNTAGMSNTAVGESALNLVTTGSNNIGVGGSAGNGLRTGNDNVSIGYNTGVTGSSSRNTAIGNYALLCIYNPSDNIGIGYYAGAYSTQGDTLNNGAAHGIYIGNDTKSSGKTLAHETVIGHDAIGNGAHTTTIGNATNTGVFLNGSLNLINSPLVSTAAVTQTKWLPVTINGVSYKLLLAD